MAKLVGTWWHFEDGRKIRAISGAGGGDQPEVKGPQVTTVQQSGDPSLVEMNKYVTGELKHTLPQYGGLKGLTDPQPYMFSDFGRTEGPEAQELGRLSSFYRGPTENPYELSGLSTMQQAADPERQLAAASDYLSRVVSPELQNYHTALGQGRSGAIGESIAREGSKMTLPILQQSAQNQMQFGGSLANYGQLQRGRELESLGNLYRMAAMPRQEQAAAEQSARDTLLSTMLRFPVASGEGRSQTAQFLPNVQAGEPPVWQQVMGGLNSVMGIASMAMMACWVAAQLYGWNDPRKFCAAFYQVNLAPKGFWARQAVKVYRRYGKRWATSRLALTVLRPIFDRVARAGARNLGVTI